MDESQILKPAPKAVNGIDSRNSRILMIECTSGDSSRATATLASAVVDPLWTTVVVVIPVKSADDGRVDMFVVTRDVWSLRFNTDFSYQGGILFFLTTLLTSDFGYYKTKSN